MKKVIVTAALLMFSGIALGQNLVIANARIIDGAGAVIDDGSIAVADGRISTVSADSTPIAGVMTIDARGMTVMPGFIDTHKHILGYSRATSEDMLSEWMSENLDRLLLETLQAGVTTVMSPGDYFPAIIDIREKLANGDLIGPRLLVAGSIFTAPNSHPAVTACRSDPYCRTSVAIEVDNPDTARAHVRRLDEAGVDFIKAVHHTAARMPDLADDVVAAIASEAEKCEIPFVVHDPFFSGMIEGAQLGVDGFVHTPYRDIGDIDSARTHLADAGIPVTTTVSINDTFVDKNGIKRTVMGNTFPPARDDFRPNQIANLKLFQETGVLLAFGTDTQPMRPYDEAVLGEAMAVGEVLPNEAVLATMTRNAAEFLFVSDEIGTLEPGKIADIVIIDGDPLADIAALANIELVIQGGQIVVDKR